MKNSFGRLVAIAVLGLALIVGGWSGGAAAKEVVVGLAAFGPHSDPHRGWGDQAHVLQHIYDGLTRIDAEGHVHPALAESWEQLTPETVRFHLRQGVEFHNGEELTAEVVKLNIERLMDPDQPRQAFSFNLTGATVVDRYTIDISHSPANPYFVHNMANTGIIASELTQYAESGPLADNPIGTGPFKFVQWIPDERIVLEANENYWRGAPEISRLVFRPIPESATRLSEVTTGGIDVMMGVPFEFIDWVNGSGAAQIQTVPSMINSVVLLRADQEDSPLADKRVRQALNYAVNVDEIIATLLGGYATKNATVLQPTVFGYDPELEPFPYDPDKARQLLAEAGYPNGFKLDYDINPEAAMLGPSDLDVSLLIARQLQNVGVELDIKLYDSAAYVSRMYIERNIAPVFNFGWKIWHNEPGALLFGLFHSDSIYAYAKNEELDDVIDRARSEFDENRSAALYREAQQLLADEALGIFLWHLDDIYAVSKRLNWQPRVDGRVYLYEASFTEP